MSPALAGIKDYCINVYIVLAYQLRADATSTPGERLETRKVCAVEFEASKLWMRPSHSDFSSPIQVDCK